MRCEFAPFCSPAVRCSWSDASDRTRASESGGRTTVLPPGGSPLVEHTGGVLRHAQGRNDGGLWLGDRAGDQGESAGVRWGQVLATRCSRDLRVPEGF